MEPGMVLAGRYELRAMLGRGGMGEVWLGYDPRLQREVAVKVLLTLSGEKSVRRFDREAALLAKVPHPGITVVHDAGRHEAHLFIVMELLVGQDMARLMTGHRDGLPVSRVRELSRQTVDALAAAHRQGVIHRDLKPANIFVQPGDRVKICDFGIARSVDGSDAVTTTGRVIGTPAYMSPEQWQAQPVDARTDLYALGAVIFELLTGRPPFSPDQSPYSLMLQHVEQAPPRPRTLRPDIPGGLEDLVLALLAKSPRDRPDLDDVSAELAGPAGQSSDSSTARARSQWATTPPTLRAPGTTRGGDSYTLRHFIKQHSGPVNSVAFSPDGRTLAADGNSNGDIRIWDAHTGRQRRVLNGHKEWVGALAFSPDGRTLVSGGQDKVLRVWDPHTGDQHRQLAGHTDWVHAVAFSPDGTTLATGSRDATARVWDPYTGQQRLTLTKHDRVVHAVAFSPDGTTLATGGDDHAARLWDPYTGKQRRKLSKGPGSVLAVAFSPDSNTLATGSGIGHDVVRVWDARTGRVRREMTAHTDWVKAVAFSPDGNTLATGGSSGDGLVIIWDPHTGEQRLILNEESYSVHALAFSPDGHALAAGCTHGILIWTIGP
jgi:eukaryotic-like serine/threonine-protein kinase